MKPDDSSVHVWLAFDAEVPDAWLRYAEPWLSADERQRAARLRTSEGARQFLLTRALQRRVLSACEPEVAPADWRFAGGETGKPALASEFGSTRLQFNLSHSRGVVAMAVARTGQLGIDVESLARGAPVHLARRYFAAREADALERLPTAEQARRFFILWTLKEAWLKAVGQGVGGGLDRAVFDFGADGWPRIAPADDGEVASASFWLAPPDGDYQLALAGIPPRGHTRVRMFRFIAASRFEYEELPAPRPV